MGHQVQRSRVQTRPRPPGSIVYWPKTLLRSQLEYIKGSNFFKDVYCHLPPSFLRLRTRPWRLLLLRWPFAWHPVSSDGPRQNIWILEPGNDGFNAQNIINAVYQLSSIWQKPRQDSKHQSFELSWRSLWWLRFAVHSLWLKLPISTHAVPIGGRKSWDLPSHWQKKSHPAIFIPGQLPQLTSQQPHHAAWRLNSRRPHQGKWSQLRLVGHPNHLSDCNWNLTFSKGNTPNAAYIYIYTHTYRVRVRVRVRVGVGVGVCGCVGVCVCACACVRAIYIYICVWLCVCVMEVSL